MSYKHLKYRCFEQLVLKTCQKLQFELFLYPKTMSLLHLRNKVCIAPFHLRSKVCIAPIHVRSKVDKFAPHMDGNNADFAPHMEGSHADLAPYMEQRQSCRDQMVGK